MREQSLGEARSGERKRIAGLIREHAHNLFWISSSSTANRLADAVEQNLWPTVFIYSKDAEHGITAISEPQPEEI